LTVATWKKESGFLYQHPTRTGRNVAGSTVTETGLFAALDRRVAAGFAVDTDGARLRVSPAARRTAPQTQWIQQHQPTRVAARVARPWRGGVEYPKARVAPDSGTRCVVNYPPEAGWRRVAADYPGAAVWPVPDGMDVAAWIDGAIAAPWRGSFTTTLARGTRPAWRCGRQARPGGVAVRRRNAA
jgi:hypothetical protein